MTVPSSITSDIRVAGAIGKGQDHYIQIAAGQVLGADFLPTRKGHRPIPGTGSPASSRDPAKTSSREG